MRSETRSFSHPAFTSRFQDDLSTPGLRLPIIGDRRPPSPLGFLQPDHWLAEYPTELINALNVLGWLVELEPQQAALLEKICAGPTITAEELRAAGSLETGPETSRGKQSFAHPELF